MGIFKGCEPANFFQYFEKISSIPRGPYHEQAISNYLKQFATDHGLEVYQDDIYNIMIKKPGTPGYESSPPVLFHGHMDMVLAKEEGVEHDMLKEGIRLKLDGEWVSGSGTTLGADNGVGLSFILCILESDDWPHPPIEAVITVQEEVGKAGLLHFDLNRITAHRLIDFNWRNSDSVYAACAGDISAYFELPAVRTSATEGWRTMKLTLHRFKGGHSEHEIVLQRANAIAALARIINAMLAEHDVRFVNLKAGVNRYAIPNYVETLLMVPEKSCDSVEAIAKRIEGELRFEYRLSDPEITVDLSESGEDSDQMFTREFTQRLVRCIRLLPEGVQSICLDRPELPESSSCISMLDTTEEKVRILLTIPSAVSSIKYDLVQKVKDLASLAGAEVSRFADCPEWPYNQNSKLLAQAKKTYRSAYGKEPGIVVAHSSLEVGLFRNRFPDMDIISVGAESTGYHTTKERFHYTTAGPAMKFIRELLKELKE